MEFPVSFLKHFYSQEDISGFNRQEPVGRPKYFPKYFRI